MTRSSAAPTLGAEDGSAERAVTGELGTDLRRKGLRSMSTRDVDDVSDCCVRELRFIGLTSFSCK